MSERPRSPRSVLVIPSDHPGWVRVEATFRNLPNVVVISAGPGRASALTAALGARPHVIVADRVIEGIPSPALFAPVLDEPPTSSLVVITDRVGRADRRIVLRGRISGYLLWDDLATPVWPAYLAAAVDGRVIVVSRQAVVAWHDAERRQAEFRDLAMTVRERRILQELAAGATHTAIAHALGIHVRTVERTIDVLQRKLEADTTARLLVRAAQLGLVD